MALLSDDVVLHSDGGGKAVALPNTIQGADSVARAILGSLKKLAPKGLVRRLAQVNGEPGVVVYLGGKPYSVFALDVIEDRVRAIYIVTNPEKLAHLPELTADAAVMPVTA